MEKLVNLFEGFYFGKKVLVTGHTGFKGSWLCKILINLGANVTGYALEAPTNPNLFQISQIENHINSIIGDIRDLKHLRSVVESFQPEIVFHLAAQPLVRDSYIDPAYTYETNVMGTVNILDAIRLSNSVKSFVNITTDKVYYNKEWEWGYREIDRLGGYDPYSNSKACSELVTDSYARSFFDQKTVAISTARAGNVIGGGDFAKNRIVPDCVKASLVNEAIEIRNPYSTRPYQHVLEPLFAYLLLAKTQYITPNVAGNYNIGPDDVDCVSNETLVNCFCNAWGNGQHWINKHDGGPHEAHFLKLDCSKFKSTFNWKPKWNIETTMLKTVEWHKAHSESENIPVLMDKQISEYAEVREKL